MEETKQQKEEIKRRQKIRKVTISKIMTPIVMILFVLVLMFFFNFQSVCHCINRSSYDRVTATLTENTVDPLTMLVPMVKIKYEYQGISYEDQKYYVLQPLFGFPTEEGSELPIYVNKEAPGYSLFQMNFFRSFVNWILLLFASVFLVFLIRRIRRGINNRKRRRLQKKEKKQNKGMEEKW